MMKSIVTNVPMNMINARSNDVTESNRLVRSFSLSRSLAATRGFSKGDAGEELGVDAIRYGPESTLTKRLAASLSLDATVNHSKTRPPYRS